MYEFDKRFSLDGVRGYLNLGRGALRAADLAYSLQNIRRIDLHFSGLLRRGERDRFEEALQHHMQAARADVALIVVEALGERGDLLQATGSEFKSTPSWASSAVYWRVSAFFGSLRMRRNCSESSACRFTRSGNRPWSSGIRSSGLES